MAAIFVLVTGFASAVISAVAVLFLDVTLLVGVTIFYVLGLGILVTFIGTGLALRAVKTTGRAYFSELR